MVKANLKSGVKSITECAIILKRNAQVEFVIYPLNLQYFQFVCQFTPQRGEGGSPIHQWGRVLPSFLMGYPPQPRSQVRVGGTPISGLDRGVSPRSSRPGKGVSLVQTLEGGTPPSPPCHPDLGRGYPPVQVPGQGGTANGNSIACTCYAVSGMPLAFKQEDFLMF